MDSKKIKKIVQEGYGKIARQERSGCGCGGGCCGSPSADTASRKIGYSGEDLASVPEGANLGLGCGNPVALASIREGETVLDLGSGAGFDSFLAAARTGEHGRVIGVDMTPDMIARARKNAEKSGYANVEFRLGEIDSLPVEDGSVDLVISNCVINLAPDKGRVFSEAFRVLKPGGRLMVSDIVVLEDLPELIRSSAEGYVGCISGALHKDEYLDIINKAGFTSVTVHGETPFPLDCVAGDPVVQEAVGDPAALADLLKKYGSSIVSIQVGGIKPAR
jgi:arsenite methyltransferase